MRVTRYYRRFGSEGLIRSALAISRRGETAVVPCVGQHGLRFHAFYKGQPLDVYASEDAALRALSVRELLAGGFNARIRGAIVAAELRGWFGARAQWRARLQRMKEAQEAGR